MTIALQQAECGTPMARLIRRGGLIFSRFDAPLELLLQDRGVSDGKDETVKSPASSNERPRHFWRAAAIPDADHNRAGALFPSCSGTGAPCPGRITLGPMLSPRICLRAHGSFNLRLIRSRRLHGCGANLIGPGGGGISLKKSWASL